jgi:dolichol phosphate-mannose biosynthesis regulatory protein
MASNNDRSNGIMILIISTSMFAYFTFWVIIMPMVDADHPLQHFFPDRYIGLAIPFLIGSICLTITTSFIGIVLAQSESK